jgi:chemosensory pili system protein ChpA (sensor histidine kinase/response regulator)
VVMLSDIEMPRMDGFDLVRNVRADARLAGLPVVMITSRIAQKHRDYAAELGVDHYLGKPYSEDELLQLVARYAGAAGRRRRLSPAAVGQRARPGCPIRCAKAALFRCQVI